MTWQKGESGNVHGRPSSGLSWQDYVVRASRIIEKYDAQQIVDICGDVKKIAKNFSGWDSIIALNLYNIYTNSDPKERERLLDRILGKAVQRVEATVQTQVDHRHTLAIETLDDDTLQIMLEALKAASQEKMQPQPITIEHGAHGLTDTPEDDS